jgi:hypothetical protein
MAEQTLVTLALVHLSDKGFRRVAAGRARTCKDRQWEEEEEEREVLVETGHCRIWRRD